MVTVYGLSRSRSTRVLWALEECGQPYDYVSVNLATGENRQPEYLRLNPGGKIPTLVDDGLVVTESAAIVNYVAARFCGELMPVDIALRAHYDRWSYFVLSELEQPLWTMVKHKFALPAEHRVKDIFATASWEYQRALKVLSQGLGDNPYILGDNFSAADILIGHTLVWGQAFDQMPAQQNIQSYMQRVTSREALKRAQTRETVAA